MTDDVVIVEMNQSHLDAVSRIEAELFTDAWSRNQFLSEIAIPVDRRYFVALRNTSVVGYIGVAVMGEDAHINNIAVVASLQRQGIGSRLLESAEQFAHDAGAEHLTLEVRASNTGARALYETYGFQQEGVRRGYYDDNREDAIVMWLRGIATPEKATP